MQSARALYLTAFSDLIVELRRRLAVAFFNGQMPECRVHLGELMRLAFDRDLEGARRCQCCRWKKQIEMPEGMLDFLFGRGFKNRRSRFISGLSGQFGEIAILDMRHRLAGEG